MKKLMLAAGVVALAGCMVTTVSKDYSADEVDSSEKLSFKKVDNIDDIESFDKSAIPVVVKAENKKEQVYSSGGIHGLLWFCTLGIIPSWQTEAETHTMNVATPLGAKSGVCTVTKRRYWGWVPYMLPFGSSEEDVQCEEELLSRLVAQYKKEWTAESVAKMNAANSERIKKLRAKADELLTQKEWSEVIKICKAVKNKAFVSEYMPKAMALRLSVLKQEVEIAMRAKDYQRVVDLCKDEKKDAELVSKRGEAIVSLIASCDNMTKLDGLMKTYEKELSTARLAEISKKAENDIVKMKLIEMVDSKIVKQLKAIDIKDEVGAKRFVELFGNMQSPKVRSKVFREIVINLMEQIGADKFYAMMMNVLLPEEIVSYYEAIAAKEESFQKEKILSRLFRHGIPRAKLLDCYAAFITKGIYPKFYSFRDGFTEPTDSDIRKIMVILDSKQLLEMYIASWLCENAQSTDIVDELFEKWKIGTEGNNANVRQFVQMFAKKLSSETKSKILADAKQKAEEKKGTKIVFGSFYMGMPYLDALLLSDELGIADDIVIYSNPPKAGACGVRDYASVWRIDFGNRSKFKFIDCADDEAVLDQIIHQLVKGKSGKVGKFHYARESRIETDDEIGCCHGYSNTRLGTKVLFNNDTGKLSLVAL